jgi:hypothetical protein
MSYASEKGWFLTILSMKKEYVITLEEREAPQCASFVLLVSVDCWLILIKAQQSVRLLVVTSPTIIS